MSEQLYCEEIMVDAQNHDNSVACDEDLANLCRMEVRC
jgi:hypothetical protein